MTRAYGNRVVVDHGEADGRRLQTTYSHLSALHTTQGSTVVPGTTLGRVGSTGLSTGPHLHFEVMLDGHYTDPVPWLDGVGEGRSSRPSRRDIRSSARRQGTGPPPLGALLRSTTQKRLSSGSARTTKSGWGG
ncbi:M23 family metallopeptidase [Actinomadura keratinilytica]